MLISGFIGLKAGSLRSRRHGASEQKKSEERDFRSFSRAKNEARAPFWRGKLLSPHSSRGQNFENPVLRTFFALKSHGNACYVG